MQKYKGLLIPSLVDGHIDFPSCLKYFNIQAEKALPCTAWRINCGGMMGCDSCLFHYKDTLLEYAIKEGLLTKSEALQLRLECGV